MPGQPPLQSPPLRADVDLAVHVPRDRRKKNRSASQRFSKKRLCPFGSGPLLASPVSLCEDSDRRLGDLASQNDSIWQVVVACGSTGSSAGHKGRLEKNLLNSTNL